MQFVNLIYFIYCITGSLSDANTSVRYRQMSEFYVFRQDSAPDHRARQTVDLLSLLTRDTPHFIPHVYRTDNLKFRGLQTVVCNAGGCLQKADKG